MPKGIPNGESCRSLSNYQDGKYLLHARNATLENGCWNNTIANKFLVVQKGEIIGYERVDGVNKEIGRQGSMVQGRCLWGSGGRNWKCSFKGKPIDGNMGNASALGRKGKRALRNRHDTSRGRGTQQQSGRAGAGALCFVGFKIWIQNQQ
jgi:hypothetical protein